MGIIMPCRTIEIIEYLASPFLYAVFIIIAIALVAGVKIYISIFTSNSLKNNDKEQNNPSPDSFN